MAQRMAKNGPKMNRGSQKWPYMGHLKSDLDEIGTQNDPLFQTKLMASITKNNLKRYRSCDILNDFK